MEYVKKDNCENKYDMVIIDINNFNLAEGISPSPSFFEENFLKQINVNFFYLNFLFNFFLENVERIRNIYNKSNGKKL